jgi:hypothetical protein
MKSSAPRVVTSSLVLAAIFEAAPFGSKETLAAYRHAPWLNDPYDTAVSFALFCIPLIVVPSGLRSESPAGATPGLAGGERTVRRDLAGHQAPSRYLASLSGCDSAMRWPPGSSSASMPSRSRASAC